MYTGEFTCWKDVSDQFKPNEYKYGGKTGGDIPEPDEVILADYDIDGYEGHAYVIYRQGDLYYTVSAGHCSCYGLEGQWEPEEYELSLLVAALQKGNKLFGGHDKEVLAKLEPRIVGKVRPIQKIADAVIELALMGVMTLPRTERKAALDKIEVIKTHFSI